MGMNSHFTIVGLGGGKVIHDGSSLPFACMLNTPYWGSRAELMEVLDLAEVGKIHAEVTHYHLEETPEVYQKLHEGKIKGRAVIIMGSSLN